MRWEILHGDCIDAMRTLEPESVDAVITSPPYAMQRRTTYGGIPEADYPAWTVAWMDEARRVLRPDGSIVVNISPHLRDGQLSDYVLRTRLAIRAAGWVECDELIWHKTDAAPTGAPWRPRRSWESLLWYAKHPRPFSDPYAAGGPPVKQGDRTVGTGRARRNGWGHDIGTMPVRDADRVRVSNVAVIGKAKASDADHPAMFPSALVEWIGKLVCPPGGTVLDPFSGSASTGVACIEQGWNYFGCEAVEEYADMSRRRLAMRDVYLFDLP